MGNILPEIGFRENSTSKKASEPETGGIGRNLERDCQVGVKVGVCIDRDELLQK